MSKKHDQPPGNHDRRGWLLAGVTLVYAAAVLGVDILATLGVQVPIDWTFFRWTAWEGPLIATGGRPPFMRAMGVDLFKFFAWFAIPFLICLPWMDWRFLGWKRWRRIDAVFMAIAFFVGLGAVSLIAFVPGLRDFYPSLAGAETADKVRFVVHMLAWTFSWLLGWEFLHRYVLLRVLDRPMPRWGWLLIPLYEGVYHLVKHPLEAVGMVLASVLLTAWTRNSRNVALPFLAHLIIEVQLILFMVLV